MIRFLRRPFVAFTIIAAVLGAAALAQQAGSRGLGEKFKKFDKNSDGKLTVDEIPADYMVRLDLDKNGEVTLDEAHRAFASAPEGKEDATPVANRMFESFDKNGDGKVTRDECGDAPWFSKIDRSGDGIITREEVLAVAAQLKQAMKKQGMDVPSPTKAAKPVAAGPKILKAGDGGVGRQVQEVKFTDVTGHTHKLSGTVGEKGLVIAITSTTCPVSKRYTPTLARLQKDLQAKGLGMLIVNPMKSEPVDAMKAQGFTATYVHDTEGSLIEALDARTTTEVFLLDRTRTLLYRGALDDQYGIAYNLDAPRNRYLADAIDEMLAGRHPSIAATEAPGCELDRPSATVSVTSSVTYHRDVARILAQNCSQCHHENGIAPFSLDTPDEVKDRAKTIKRVVSEGTMPPWFAKDDKPNRWANDHSLSPRDKADLLAWIESSDRPLGDVADAPKPITYPAGGWTYGTPDAVFEFAQAQPIKAEGKMPYVNVKVNTGLNEDRWVQAIEVQPGNRQVVHHIIVSVVDPKHPRSRVSAEEGFFAAYVPGNGGDQFPVGFARKLPAGAVLNFQMHYTPNGKA
ncbi:MAG: Redoxin domain protein, partial [Verrucomicrobiaceae bacterium]|nr:Redoxin domain protein [Verrucomicrobiaceae bacterium]